MSRSTPSSSLAPLTLGRAAPRGWRGLGAALVLVLALASHAAAKPDAKQAKINTYVEILNTWSPAVFKARDGYATWANLDTGPTCKERNIRPIGGFGTSAPATFAGYAKAAKKAPKLEVDAAVVRMLDALTALVEPTNEAAKYYARGYREDGCKRGQELHPLLVAGWKQYLEAERELRAFVVAYNDEVAIKALAAAKKKYGAKFRYHFEKLLIDGKALLREIDAQTQAPTPDLAAIRARIATYAETHASVSALHDQAKPDKKLRDDLYQGGYSQLVRQADNLSRSSTRLVEALESPPGKPRARALEQAHKQVIVDYNALIDAANKTRFSARIK